MFIKADDIGKRAVSFCELSTLAPFQSDLRFITLLF
jgi:hypothetical protein